MCIFYFILENYESRSKLSKQLSDILKDRNCLCYLIQYLETRDALPLIKFYIDVESFQKAAELCGDSGGVVPRNDRMLRSASTDGYESISIRSQSMESVSNFSVQSETNFPDLSDVDEENMSSTTTPTPTQMEMTKEEKTKVNLQSTVIADAIRIYRKYLVRTSVFFIDIPATISSTISLALCNKDEISASLFSSAQDFVYKQLEHDFLEPFLTSIFYCKYTVDVLTSDNLTLHDILYNESILFYFMEFLEQEEARTFLEFWLTATNFKRNLRDDEQKQAQSDALVLYEKYFSLQAKTPLNVSDNVRFIVENRICSMNEPVRGSFDLPIRIVEFYLDRNYLNPFLKSNLFYKYLSELFSKINEHKLPQKSNNKKSHKRNHSEPISNGNTLLAMESKSSTKNSQQKTNMQIESQQLYDPDTLWRRRDPKTLSFGRVDAFGRYQREFELDPSMNHRTSLNHTSNKLRNAVRRLVKLPEDKVQEEIAWQVAEMIVKDVTSITLNSSQELPKQT